MPKTGRAFFKWTWWLPVALCALASFGLGDAWAQKKDAPAPAPAATASAPAPAPAGPDASTLAERVAKLEQELEKYQAVEQTRREGAEKLLEERGKGTEERFQAQNNRIGDISGQIDRFGILLTAFACIITLAVFVGGLKIYKDARDDAKRQAEDWMKANFEDIVRRVKSKSEEELDEYIDSVKQDLKGNVERIVVELKESASSKADDMFQELDKTLKDKLNGITPGGDIDKDQMELINVVGKGLKSIPEAEYTADQLYAKGMTEFYSARYDSALEYFSQAASKAGAPAATVANALVAKGVSLEKMKLYGETLAPYDEVLRRFGVSDDPAIQGTVATALFNKGVAYVMLDRSEEGLAAYDAVVSHFGESVEPHTQEQVAKALVNKGVTIGKMDRPDEELMAYEEVVRRFEQSSEPRIQKQVAMALNNKGVAQVKQNRHEDAMAAYDEVVQRFGKSIEPGIQKQVAIALFNKGLALELLDRREEELAAYDEIVRRFGGSIVPGVQEQVASALVNKGVVLGKLDRREKQLTTYNEVVRRFGESIEPDIQEQVAKALVNKGVAFGDLDRHEEGLTAYDEVVRRFGKTVKPRIQEPVAGALVNKGVVLGILDRPEEELAAYDEVVRCFGSSSEPGVQEKVAMARNGIGFAHLKEAKRSWSDSAKREQALSTALDEFNMALQNYPDKPLVLGNQSYALFLLGRREEAREPMRQALKDGGEEQYNYEVKDAALHPVPEDADFLAFLDEVWREVHGTEPPKAAPAKEGEGK